MNLKISYDIMSKHFQTFQSPYSLSQASMLFHTAYCPLSEFCDPYDCVKSSKEFFFWIS